MFTLSNTQADSKRILRFGCVGLINTALGYSVIVAALALGWGDILSNLTGYAAGLLLGFFLNRNWTFKSAAHGDRTTVPKYLTAFFVAFSVNLGIVAIARAFGIIDNPLTHAAGICAYTVVFYAICTRYVFAPSKLPVETQSPSLGASFMARRWPELGVFAAWLVLFLFVPVISVSHDVVWQMWIARQLLGGTELYTGIMEVNPPLWFWMAVPVEWLAQTVPVPSSSAIVVATLVMIGVSLTILSFLVAAESLRVRMSILWPALAALVLIPLTDFAQREHLCLIGTIPYLVLAARRADGHSVAWSTALAAGLVAAPAFALKHYFILVPVLLEAWLVYRLGRRWTPLRPETLALLFCALFYALAVLVFTPEYLTAIVPMLRTAYDGYGAPFSYMISNPWVVIWLFTALALWMGRDATCSLSQSAAITAAALALSYLAQQKGWNYHALPVTGALFFAVANRLLVVKWVGERAATLVILAVAAALTARASITNGPYTNPHAAQVNELLGQSKPGATAIMLTGHPSRIWPMIETAGLKWPSRHIAFWMTHAISAREKTNRPLPDDLRELAITIRKQTVEDLLCNPPDLILVDDFSNSNSPGFDILGFFEKDEDFRQLFSHYVEHETRAMFTSYQKRSSWREKPVSSCRTIH